MHAVSMLRLRRRLGLDRAGDRGGVAVVVGILLAAGVLLGLGALVVDVGNLYAEREQLQSGADSAAVKVAQACGKNLANCTSPNGTTLAGGYANANAADGVSGVSTVCGRGGSLLPCPAPAQNLTACVKPAPKTGNYVEVRTVTKTADGSTILPATFARALVGGYSGTEVGACARAAWGAPMAGALSVTISLCEWWAATVHGTVFPSAEMVIYLHDNSKPSTGTCTPNGPSGADAPGGFGWLNDPNSDCKTPILANGTYTADPGNNVSKACKTMLNLLWSSHQPVLMPVYSLVNGVTGSGRGVTYTLAGFAEFVVTGWDLPGFKQTSWMPGSTVKCNSGKGSSNTCIFGYFTKGLVPGTGDLGGPDLGASIVALIG